MYLIDIFFKLLSNPQIIAAFIGGFSGALFTYVFVIFFEKTSKRTSIHYNTVVKSEKLLLQNFEISNSMLFVIDEIRKCIKESLDEKRPAITPQFIDEFVIDTYYLSDLIGIKLVNMMEELFIYMRRVNRGIQATNKQYSYLSNLVITKQFEQDAQVQMKVFYFYVNAIGGMNENLEAMRKMIELEIRPKIKSITAYVRALLEKKPISKNLFEKLFANKYVQIDASMVNEKLRELETELVSNQRLHEERLRQIYGVDASHKE